MVIKNNICGVDPEREKGDGRLRPSLQQRLPGAEGPPEGCSTAPRPALAGFLFFPSRLPALSFCAAENAGGVQIGPHAITPLEAGAQRAAICRSARTTAAAGALMVQHARRAASG